MARFNVDTADKYGGQGGSGFFSLGDDGDTATVRFLYNTSDDLECFSVHEIEVNGKKRYVDCLRQYNDPVDECPFCAVGKPVSAKMIIPVYDVDEQRTKIWERGKSFIPTIKGVCERYNKHTIVSQMFDIERQGAKGEQTTKYAIYRTEDPADDTVLEDFEMPNIIGPKGFILEKNAEEMEFYLDNGQFPEDEDEEAPVRRNTGRTQTESAADRHSDDGRRTSRRTGRRTPTDTF